LALGSSATASPAHLPVFALFGKAARGPSPAGRRAYGVAPFEARA
jgi:hypothetical protein